MANEPRVAPLFFMAPNLQEHLRKLAGYINDGLNGKSNAVGSFALVSATVSTTVSNQYVSPASVISIMPTNLAGATELYAGTMFDGLWRSQNRGAAFGS